ncbi:hypothetical protein HNQ34_001680 [Anoxybacillus tepidamans]|uniref:Uncharacterized protein n=1 Tax=Anoxybacteroides tepidamans TaxID=265948 RepID=A0A7W8MV66_9BACL|nr:hypothetical protein [Anoxybacillus tepidamans]MBB5324583.1 hypothetical protein [Anoxybacillus tepidamans]
MKNEKGVSLITVLLITLIFMTIGLAIISASINGTLRTEIRETDIDVTYQANNIMEEIVADLKLAMQKKDPLNPNQPLPASYYLPLSKTGGTVDANFDPTLTRLLNEKIIPKYSTYVESLQIKDISTEKPYYINKQLHFTRVLEIKVTVKDAHQATIKRTMKRNVILSPTPSFLQYAVGSQQELEINGSPNILGNVFANDLKISQNAKFYTTNNVLMEIPTPFPSIFGDVYSEGKDVQTSLSENNFYKQKMPLFKNDSHFIDVNFNETFNKQADKLLYNITGENIRYSNGNFIASFENYANNLIANSSGISIFFPRDDEETSIELSSLASDEEIVLQSNNNETILLTNTDNTMRTKPLKIRGDVSLSNISRLELPDLIVQGDLTITNYGDLQIGNLFVTGNVTISNFIRNNAKGMLQYNTVVGGNLEVVSDTDFQINGNVFINGNTKLVTRDSSFTIRGYVMGNGDFYVLGNDDLNKNEDDNFIFDSVVYVMGQSFISSANILGADNNDKQLVLLSNGNLTITRINEFRNFSTMNEPANFNGEVTDTAIKPLHAFFYTHQNAELYGVGSLFYIDGGLFAREHLVINAIRGEITNHSEQSLMNMANDSTQPTLQTNKLSRFNVKYDKKVLLRRIDDLPLVDELQVIPDAIELQ